MRLPLAPRPSSYSLPFFEPGSAPLTPSLVESLPRRGPPPPPAAGISDKFSERPIDQLPHHFPHGDKLLHSASVTVSFPPASSREADIAGIIQAAVTAGRPCSIIRRVPHSKSMSAWRKAFEPVSVVLDKEGESVWAAGCCMWLARAHHWPPPAAAASPAAAAGCTAA